MMTRRWRLIRLRWCVVVFLSCLTVPQTACYTRVGSPGKEISGSAVENVDFSISQGGTIVVRYDLLGKGDYTVSLLLLGLDGAGIRPLSLSGAVGPTKPGSDLVIVWDVLRDFPDGLVGNDYVFEISASQIGGGINKGVAMLGGLSVIAGTALLSSGTLVDQPRERGTIVIDIPDPDGQ
jgi:hypothetical protein